MLQGAITNTLKKNRETKLLKRNRRYKNEPN